METGGMGMIMERRAPDVFEVQPLRLTSQDQELLDLLKQAQVEAFQSFGIPAPFLKPLSVTIDKGTIDEGGEHGA